jgi:hypothetical protein
MTYQPREAVRDRNGNVFSMEHLAPPPSPAEANFNRLSQARLDADLDAAHKQRAVECMNIPAGQQATHADAAVANRNWAIAAKRAEAFWTARRDTFYLRELGKLPPGMSRPPNGQIVMNPFPPFLRDKWGAENVPNPEHQLRTDALQHADAWLARHKAEINAPPPAAPVASKADIAAIKQEIIDRLLREELVKRGFAS